MSVLELLFALLLVCLLAGLAVLAALTWSVVRRSEQQARDVAELKARLVAGGQTQDSHAAALRDGVTRTQTVIEGLRSALAARQQMEEQDRAALRRMEHILAGSSTRGAAGEHILEEALRHLPPEMLQRNIWVAGKVVELALRLPGGRLLPIDSKWVSSPALEQLAEPALDATRRANLVGQVEREVERRVKEVSQYIDPAVTSPFALAVIPDAAYDVCRGAIVNAHHRHVMVVGYAMALPYLLTLYQLHMQFSRTVDMEKLQSALIDIERQVDVLEGILENRLQRSLTVLQNAYTEGKQASAKIRASAQAVQIVEGPVEDLSTGSHSAPEELSTDTLRLALLDSVQ